MKGIVKGVLALSLCVTGRADFSYSQATKTTGGMLAAMVGKNGERTNTVSLKGQKMRTDDGKSVMLIDFDAQTVTTMNVAQKSYTVRDFSELAPGSSDLNAKADVKETGKKKTVNGYDATEAVMSMEMDAPQIGRAQVEIDMWLSTEVAGSQELRRFYSKNAEKFPWKAMTGGSNPTMGAALAELQKKMASLNSAPVQQIVRIKAPGALPGGAAGAGGAPPAGPSTAQMGQMQAGMEKARKQLEALAAGGGPAAAIAKQQLERMGPPPAAQGTPAGGEWLLELTIDSTGFSSAPLADTLFAIPEGYQKQ